MGFSEGGRLDRGNAVRPKKLWQCSFKKGRVVHSCVQEVASGTRVGDAPTSQGEVAVSRKILEAREGLE